MIIDKVCIILELTPKMVYCFFGQAQMNSTKNIWLALRVQITENLTSVFTKTLVEWKNTHSLSNLNIYEKFMVRGREWQSSRIPLWV